MLMLQHKFEVEHKDDSCEIRTSTLLEYGNTKGYSAMAKLVLSLVVLLSRWFLMVLLVKRVFWLL